MTPSLILLVVAGYFALLIVISWFTGRGADTEGFFLGNRRSPWFVVAFGMIGASLSGVTFISVPGWVGGSQFSYMQMVLGYLAGYFVIATVLMPLYYRLNLTTIYTYLLQRFGFWSYKTGALFFFVSRVVGSALRLFLVADVLQVTVFDRMEGLHVPFPATVFITIGLIWLYTFRGGIKTIVWTDTLQTAFMLAAVGASIFIIGKDLGLGPSGIISAVAESDHSRWLFWDDWQSGQHFVKQFLAGAFIAITMTGLDQDMMQKNLSCRNIRDAQKNMFTFSGILVVVNLFFLSLGALLYIYAEAKGIAVPEQTDRLYPLLAVGHLGPAAGLFFILGLVAAAYSSADSALTALTTSFCVDFLDIAKKPERGKVRMRMTVHIALSFLMAGVILLFHRLNDASVVEAVFASAGYTYGPLLGLFAFGICTKLQVRDGWWILLSCLAAPALTYTLNVYSEQLFAGYRFGFELIIMNGLITMLLLAIFIRRKKT